MAETRQSSRIENGGKARLFKVGTVPAFIPSSKSVASLSAGATAGAWGGARNRADRVSDGITLKQAQGLIAAVQFAQSAGMPLNRHLTIHWEKAGVIDADVPKVQGTFLKLANDWSRTRGERLTYAYVRENGDDKGSHSHLLIQLGNRAERAFFGMQRGWIKRATGQPYRRGVIHSRRIAGLSAGELPLGIPLALQCQRYYQNLATVLGYLLKGSNPDAALLLGLERLETGGFITGKRVGWSDNIGSRARSRFNVR
jgi:hypothetical protein